MTEPIKLTWISFDYLQDRGLIIYTDSYEQSKILEDQILENQKLREDIDKHWQDMEKQAISKTEKHIKNLVEKAEKYDELMEEYQNITARALKEITGMRMCKCGHSIAEHSDNCMGEIIFCGHLNSDNETYCDCNKFKSILKGEKK